MLIFIKKIAYITLIISTLSITLLYLSNTWVGQKAYVTIATDTRYVILGNSHPERGINDSLINGVENFALSAESYLYTLAKIRQIKTQKPHIIIEISSHQILQSSDKWLLGDYYLGGRYSRFAPLLTRDEHFFLIKNNPSGWLRSYPKTIQRQWLRILRSDFDFRDMGGYFPLFQSKIDSIRQANLQYPLPKLAAADLATGGHNLLLLRKTIDYCHQYQIPISLIRCPLHADYQGFEYEETFQNIIKTQFSDVPFLDFARLSLPDDAYGDYEHLSHKGARIFSLKLDSLWNK